MWDRHNTANLALITAGKVQCETVDAFASRIRQLFPQCFIDRSRWNGAIKVLFFQAGKRSAFGRDFLAMFDALLLSLNTFGYKRYFGASEQWTLHYLWRNESVIWNHVYTFTSSRALFVDGPCALRCIFSGRVSCSSEKESRERKCQTVHDQEFGVFRQKGHVLGKGHMTWKRMQWSENKSVELFPLEIFPFVRTEANNREEETNCSFENRGAVTLAIRTSILRPH